MIGWALLFMVAAGSAVTVYVTNEQDAIAELAKGVALVQGKCHVLSIEKSVESEAEIASKDYEVAIELQFTKDGAYDRRITTIHSSATDDKTLKPLVAKACDSKWDAIQNEQGLKKTVVIQPKASILDQWYDLAARTWQNKAGG